MTTATQVERYSVSRELRHDRFTQVLIAAWIAASLAFIPTLPDPSPVHWGASGQADRFGSPIEAATGMPLVSAGLYLLLVFLPALDRQSANLAKYPNAYRTIRLAVVLFLLAAWAPRMLEGIGYVVPTSAIDALGMSALLILIGNVLPQVRRNSVVGIRTPWSMKSDDAWRRTHRHGGHITVACGLVGLGGSIALPDKAFTISMSAFAVATVAVVIWSYAALKASERTATPE